MKFPEAGRMKHCTNFCACAKFSMLYLNLNRHWLGLAAQISASHVQTLVRANSKAAQQWKLIFPPKEPGVEGLLCEKGVERYRCVCTKKCPHVNIYGEQKKVSTQTSTLRNCHGDPEKVLVFVCCTLTYLLFHLVSKIFLSPASSD